MTGTTASIPAASTVMTLGHFPVSAMNVVPNATTAVPPAHRNTTSDTP